MSESASESARRRVVASTAWEHGVPWVTFSVFDGSASDEVEDDGPPAGRGGRSG